MSRVLFFIALLAAITTIITGAPAPIPLDTDTTSLNLGNALLARNDTAVAFRNIWLNCGLAITDHGTDGQVYFCGPGLQLQNNDYWLKAGQCQSLCKCNCNKEVSCKKWKQCDANKVPQDLYNWRFMESGLLLRRGLQQALFRC